MSDDLESCCHEELTGADGPVTRKIKEQANRIEKLEVTLNRVVDLTNCWENNLISQVNEIVRNALEGKDD